MGAVKIPTLGQNATRSELKPRIDAIETLGIDRA
jgi:hypothetical protein